MDIDQIRSALQLVFPLCDLEYHACIGSTNDRARELARLGAPAGTLVIAERQTEGRGRRGHRWLAEPGSALLLSIALRPAFERQCWPLIGLATAAAVAEAVRGITGAPARCKWPNDVLLPRPGGGLPGKVAGILAEAGEDFVVVGVGINVSGAPGLAADGASLPATSVAEAVGKAPAREGLLVRALQLLGGHCHALDGGDARVVRQAYTRLDITAGMTVTFHVGTGAVRGVARGIDATGALVVDTGSGRRRLSAGDVHLEWDADDWMIG